MRQEEGIKEIYTVADKLSKKNTRNISLFMVNSKG